MADEDPDEGIVDNWEDADTEVRSRELLPKRTLQAVYSQGLSGVILTRRGQSVQWTTPYTSDFRRRSILKISANQIQPHGLTLYKILVYV